MFFRLILLKQKLWEVMIILYILINTLIWEINYLLFVAVNECGMKELFNILILLYNIK